MESSRVEFKFEDFVDIKLQTGNSYQKITSFHKPTAKKYFLKCYDTNPKVNTEIKDKIEKEKLFGENSHHDNLVELLGYFENNKVHYFVFPLFEKNLKNDIDDRKSKITEKEKFNIFFQVLEGAHYMHQQGFLHRDIKTENILISFNANNQQIFKLGDYNSSKVLVTALTQRIGTMAYMAPEVLDNHFYSEKIDFWSLGMVLFELLQGKLPWSNLSYLDDSKLRSELMNFDVKTHKFFTAINHNLRTLLEGLLEKIPNKRLGYWGIKTLPAYNKYLEENNIKENLEYLDLNNATNYSSVYMKEIYFKEIQVKKWLKKPIQKIIHVKTLKEYGILLVEYQNVSSNEFEEVKKLCTEEIELSKNIDFINLSPIHNFYYSNDKKQMNLVYPYNLGGRLSEILYFHGKLEEKIAFKIIYQLATALDELHDKSLIHNDISPDCVNISVTDDGERIYSLIGLGKSNKAKKIMEKNECIVYQSIEYLQNNTVTIKSDYWSLGVLYYKMIKGVTPWQYADANTKEKIQQLKEEIISFMPIKLLNDTELSENSKNVLSGLLAINPSDRMGFLGLTASELHNKYIKPKHKKPSEIPFLEEKDIDVEKQNKLMLILF